jgi:short/branched chain acyl-CoA dehydrogenase
VGRQRLEAVHHQLRLVDHLGWHASDTHPLSFTDARVPEANLLGERGRGYAQFLATLDDGRVAIAALAVGCIQACLDMSLQYAGERQTFGGPIGRKQGLAFQVSDLQVMLDASRLLTYKAAAMKDAMDAGSSVSTGAFKQAAAVAKLYATESAVTATRIATQVFGGYGFMEEYPVVRFYRDAKVLEIGEGTSEVQRMLIARGLGLPVE